ncbi:MAG: hypothetical protein ABI824_18540 [Acidobacteriota bacterium]
MGLLVQLNPVVQARLEAEAQALGLALAEYAAYLLEDATVHAEPPSAERTDPPEVQRWLDQLAQLSARIPAMPGETFSRDMIYQGHD